MTTLPPAAPQRRLERLITLARGAQIWEAGWRCALAVLVGVALFLSLAWFGLLLDTAPAGRIAAFVGCVAVAAVGIWQGVAGIGWAAFRPSRPAALARIDRDSGFAHGEARSVDDTLANPSDPATAALWRLHQTRLATRLAGARVAPPRPQTARFDRFALRGAVLPLLLASAFVAGDERGARLLSAFDWGGAPAFGGAGVRVDAWIDPPAYTGKPPIVLGGDRADGGAVTAPVGSAIVVRASDPTALSVTQDGAIAPKPAEPGAKGDGAQRFVLKGDGVLRYAAGSTRAAVPITAVPDKPPTITLTGSPKANARASLTLNYRLDDDYGVISAEAAFSAPEIDGHPVTGRTLVAPPRVALALPVGQNGLGDASTTTDLSDHAWAGAQTTMVLHAHDEGGNEGASDPVSVVLPQRHFAKPLARALVEQRRKLVLDPDHRERVASALAGLMIAPDLFGTPAGAYLGLRVATERLGAARTDPALLDVADLLWAMALQIENGDQSEAERDLRAAQKELQDALARNAPPEEIGKLTQNLRAAMDKFLNEMAQRQAREDAERGNEPPQGGNRNARTISRDDLKAMMDRMEESARSGDLADAQRMLEQMQNILENLRTARRGKRNGQAQEARRALNDLDALTREQQQLRDDTFRNERSSRPPRGKGARRKGENGAQQQPGGDDDQSVDDDADAGNDGGAQPSSKDLQARQKALRDKLADLQRRLDRMRKDGDNALGDAGGAMKDAEDALDDDGTQPGDKPGNQPGGRQGQKGGGGQSKGRGQGAGRDAAVDAQGRALDALRQGAQNLAQQMQQGGGQAQGDGDPDDGDDPSADGDGEPGSGQPRQADGESRDPLGRSTSRDPLYNPRAKYDPLGTSPALRAQRVLEELRRRLGETARPQEEIDYLERLLRRY